jgi:hypothetical protein
VVGVLDRYTQRKALAPLSASVACSIKIAFQLRFMAMELGPIDKVLLDMIVTLDLWASFIFPFPFKVKVLTF